MPAHRSRRNASRETADRQPLTYHKEQVENEHQVLDGFRCQTQLRHCRRTVGYDLNYM